MQSDEVPVSGGELHLGQRRRERHRAGGSLRQPTGLRDAERDDREHPDEELWREDLARADGDQQDGERSHWNEGGGGTQDAPLPPHQGVDRAHDEHQHPW